MSQPTEVPRATVTVSLRPDDGDETAWYDEVERRAWDIQDRSGRWRTTDEDIVSVRGGRFG
jgi:hypothetical protein